MANRILSEAALETEANALSRGLQIANEFFSFRYVLGFIYKETCDTIYTNRQILV